MRLRIHPAGVRHVGTSVHNFVAGGSAGMRRRVSMDRSMDTKPTVDCPRPRLSHCNAEFALRGFKHAACGGAAVAELGIPLARLSGSACARPGGGARAGRIHPVRAIKPTYMNTDHESASGDPKRHCCVRGWEQRLSCLVDECRSLCRPVGRVLGVRRVPVSTGGDHLGGALVSAVRALLP